MSEIKFVVLVDHSAGNESVGEMWVETKIFSGEDTLKQVMEWAEGKHAPDTHSMKNIRLTRAHEERQ